MRIKARILFVVTFSLAFVHAQQPTVEFRLGERLMTAEEILAAGRSQDHRWIYRILQEAKWDPKWERTLALAKLGHRKGKKNLLCRWKRDTAYGLRFLSHDLKYVGGYLAISEYEKALVSPEEMYLDKGPFSDVITPEQRKGPHRVAMEGLAVILNEVIPDMSVEKLGKHELLRLLEVHRTKLKQLKPSAVVDLKCN